MTHQEYFNYYKATNKTHTLIELFFLLAIAGIPFNNHFITAFPTELAPRFAISSDVFFAGMLIFLSWSYATTDRRLVDSDAMSPGVVTFMRFQALIMPMIALLAAGAALMHPYAWDAIMFVGPILGMFFLKRRISR